MSTRAGDRPTGIPGKALIWLMAGFALLLIPQWDRLPPWLLGACVVLASWRWVVQQGYMRMPSRWLRYALMFGLLGFYVATVQGRFTVDTAASFFVLALGLKWMETRTARDFYVLFFILIYLSAVNFLFVTSLAWTVLNLAGVLILLVSLQVLNAPDQPAPVRQGARRLGWMMLKTLPVVILLFVFFPRMAPLWSVPMVSGQATTGITDSMEPGSISDLAQSSARAFRVTFGGDIPPYPERYWRGLILDRFDGRRWTQSEAPPSGRAAPVAIDGGVGVLEAGQYDVLQEPTFQRWAFALADSMPVSDNIVETPDNLFRFRRPADSSVRYRLALSSTPGDWLTELSADDRRRYLQLPVEGNPRARELAAELRGRYESPRGVVDSLMRRFREQPYFYTLRPPAMTDNHVDRLLFDDRRGFCAHYASATAFVLRAAGIPARVVAGYHGGSAGANNAYLIIRQYDAHAWVEVWLDGRWHRIDPTGQIAPERIESGLRDAMAAEGSFLANAWASPERYQNIPMVRWVSLQVDRLNYNWQRWVVGYQGQSQLDLMSRLGNRMSLAQLGYLTAGVVGGALLIAGLVSLSAQYRRRHRDPVMVQLQRWQRLLAKAGLPVIAGETPAATAARAADCWPECASDLEAFARLVNRHYYQSANKQDLLTLSALNKRIKTQMKAATRNRGARIGETMT
ncbi:MAG: DUF3488 and transglutaminase-like domain-containing protein [Marinobacter sp.]|nr:DUF3488 and transglutaminase-like domain-containing protein [Marinobacter sp.]